MTPIRLPGKKFSIDISFPWEEGVLIRLSLIDKSNHDKVAEEWIKPIPKEVVQKYWMFLPKAKQILGELFR